MLKRIKLFIGILTVLLIISAVGLILVISKIDISKNELQALTYFYTSLFLTTFSGSALIGFGLRRRFGVRELAVWHLKTSLRQGAWIALAVAITLFIQSARSLTWVNSLLLAGTIVFLEFYFVSRERRQQQPDQ